MTEKAELRGVDHEDGSLMLALSTTKSTALTTSADTECGETEWQRDNPFNRGPHRCRLPKGHASAHRCGENNGTKDGCAYSWDRIPEHKHECQHGHPHEGRCECVCGNEALSASKVGGPENWYSPA